MDVTEEILHQHAQQRRLFAVLDEIDPSDRDSLGAIWNRLAVLLETHAAAEEKFVYPRLLRSGDGPPGEDGPEEETKDAVKDHNEIRDAVRRANAEPAGTKAWWNAVRDARESNSDHMAEEERDDLPDFRRTVDFDDRHRIAVDFLVYQANHPTGVERKDRDPDAYVAHPS
jgi:hypothetical protein